MVSFNILIKKVKKKKVFAPEMKYNLYLLYIYR